MSLFTRFLMFLPFVMMCLNLQAQVTRLSFDSLTTDSSFYEIKRMPDSSFWIGGEHGVLYRLSAQGELHPVAYPNAGTNIYQVEAFDAQHFLVCADRGYLYLYNTTSNAWQVVRLKGFHRFGFYSCVVVDSLTAFVCGGKTRICIGRKDIPFGFILKTTDGGHTWKRVHRSLGSMFWDLDYDSVMQQITAVKYNLRGTRLLRAKVVGIPHWQRSKRYRCLAHEYLPSRQLLTGGCDFRYQRKGCYYSGAGDKRHTTPYMLWDVIADGETELFAATGGNLLLRRPGQDTCEVLHTGFPVNLYSLTAEHTHTVLVCGSNKTLLRIQLR